MSIKRKIKLPADSLVQGVSQQADTKMTLNHCRGRKNIIPSPIYGNTKRPSSDFVARLDIPSGSKFLEHIYTRDSAESYVVIHTGSELRVFDRKTGEKKQVNTPHGKGYLSSPNGPRQDFTFLTLGDYTFVCNKTKKVRLSDSKTPSLPKRALLYVTQGDYKVTYKVYVNGSKKAEFTSSETDQAQTSIDYIAQQLKTQLSANLGSGYSVTGRGSVLLVSKKSGGAFTMTATDSINNQVVQVVTTEIQRFEDLPARAPNGYTVKVTRSGGEDVDDYYVRFDATDPSQEASEGVWVETVAPSVRYALDPFTMPHVLVRDANGSFTFRRGNWGGRDAGDDATVPAPSFVGRTINFMYFYENRLSFLSGGNMVTSRTSNYFNFWRQSARTKLDTDPVDVAATTSNALELLYAFPFDEKLVIFSDKALLFSRGSGGKYTPATATLQVSEAMEMDPRSVPVVAGNSIFYLVKVGEHQAVMEARAALDKDGRLPTEEVTAHVPKYIPYGKYRLAASAQAKTLLLIPQDGSRQIFSYHWMRRNNELEVISWQEHELAEGAIPRGGRFEEGSAFLLSVLGSTVVLTCLSFDEDGRFSGDLSDAHLDVRVAAKIVSYDRSTDETTVTLPVRHPNPTVLAITSDGELVDLTGASVSDTPLNASASGTSPIRRMVFPGDLVSVVVGCSFTVSHLFGRPYPMRFGSRGEMVPDLTKRFQLGKLTLNLTDTGPCEVEVRRRHRSDRTEYWTGRLIGDPSSSPGKAPVASGAFQVTLRGQSEELDVELRSNSWMPLCYTSAEWQGILMRRLG